MKKGIAKPDKNSGKKMVLLAQTRNPVEAFAMLKAGHPIDQAAGYYEKQGVDISDFYMMDKIGKLQALAAYKEIVATGKKELAEFNEAVQKQKAEAAFQERVNQEVTKKMQTYVTENTSGANQGKVS